MLTCRGCGVEIVRRSARVYCSNACQRAYERRRRIDAWLAGGPATPASRRVHYVRTYLYEAQDGRCAICGMAAQWQGQELVLVLDHIDGNATDNVRDNLRLVCPNCDSQPPTYKSRNKGKGRHYRRERYANGKSY